MSSAVIWPASGFNVTNAHGLSRMWSARAFHNGVFSFEAHLAQRQLEGAARLSVGVRPARVRG